jgi:hypothetical protein
VTGLVPGNAAAVVTSPTANNETEDLIMKKVTDYCYVVKNGKVMVSVCIDNKWEYVTEKEFSRMEV